MALQECRLVRSDISQEIARASEKFAAAHHRVDLVGVVHGGDIVADGDHLAASDSRSSAPSVGIAAAGEYIDPDRKATALL